MRTTLALMFGWVCGSLTIAAELPIWGSLLIALLAGMSFGVGQAIWDNHEHRH